MKLKKDLLLITLKGSEQDKHPCFKIYLDREYWNTHDFIKKPTVDYLLSGDTLTMDITERHGFYKINLNWMVRKR